MIFRKLKGVNLPVEMQGYIRFTCLTYKAQPGRVRAKIDRMCRECGGEYADALFDVMCSKESITAISLKHSVSQSVIYRMRKRFYESW